MGIEPTLSAWEADALSLSYTRIATIIISDEQGFVNAYSVEPWRRLQKVQRQTNFKNPLQSENRCAKISFVLNYFKNCNRYTPV